MGEIISVCREKNISKSYRYIREEKIFRDFMNELIDDAARVNKTTLKKMIEGIEDTLKSNLDPVELNAFRRALTNHDSEQYDVRKREAFYVRQLDEKRYFESLRVFFGDMTQAEFEEGSNYTRYWDRWADFHYNSENDLKKALNELDKSLKIIS